MSPAAKPADGAIWWGRELFKTGPDLDQPCPEAIDVTGSMRVLVFGPMLILPAGPWRLAARFALTAEAARNPFILQFIHGQDLAEQTFRPTGPGAYEVALETSFGLDAVAALRLWLGRAAFHGELRFQGASVQRPAGYDPASGSPDKGAAA